MLHLATKTGSDWAPWAMANLDEVLIDHAHCEKKAASTAVNLIFKYAHVPQLMVPLSQLAREELEHFEQVLEHVRRRGHEYRRLRPSPYAGALMTICRTSEPGRLVDTLLCCAMIEARSCERMQLLHAEMSIRDASGDPASDPDLTALYGSLLASEARHHTTYVELAASVDAHDGMTVRRRLEAIAAHEAEAIAATPPVPRLHNEPPRRE